MKLSELIASAQKVLNEHGDLDLGVYTGWNDHCFMTENYGATVEYCAPNEWPSYSDWDFEGAVLRIE